MRCTDMKKGKTLDSKLRVGQELRMGLKERKYKAGSQAVLQ